MLSEQVNNTEELRSWFRSCPAIIRGNRFNVDYVADTATEYAIFSVPSALKYHRNILGGEILDAIQVQNFIFTSKQPYGADIRQNLVNLGFLQEIAEWVLEQNNTRAFPPWNSGRIKSIIPTLTGAPVSVGSSAATYQIHLKITYRRAGNK